MTDTQSRSKRLPRAIAATILTVMTLATAVFVNPEPADAAWTTINAIPNYPTVVACKQPINSIYGPLWKITIASANGTNRHQNIWAQTQRSGASVGPTYHASLPAGTWGPRGTMYASRSPQMNDILSVSMNTGTYRLTRYISAARLSYC